MKNILKIILFVLTITSCKAQNTYPLSSFQPRQLKNNNYIKDTQNVYDNFAGTWQWTNGTSTFTIKLQKVEHWKLTNDKYFDDLIMGGYQFINNDGASMVNNLSFIVPSITNEVESLNYPKMFGRISYPLINELGMIVRDVINEKACMANLTLITSGTTPQIQWHLQDFEHYRPSSLGDKPLDFSIPTDLILTKLP